MRFTLYIQLLAFLILGMSYPAGAQNSQIDSIQLLIQNDAPDTNKVLHLNHLADEYVNLGIYDKALANVEEARELAHQLGYKYGECLSYNNIGIIYYYKSDYPKTLDNYFKALKLDEEMGDQTGIAMRISNIGMVYADQGDYTHALENINKALQLNEKIGRKMGVSKCYSHLGLVYEYQKNYKKALEYYTKSITIDESIHNQKGIAGTLDNMGNIYYMQGDFASALINYNKAVVIYKQLNSLQDLVLNIGNIGAVYMEQKKYKEAEKNLLEALHFSDSLGLIYFQKDNHTNLSQLYELTNQPAKALLHYKASIAARDSIFNEANTKKLVRVEMNFEFEKKQALEKAEQDKKDAIANEKAQKQLLIRNFLLLGLLLVLILALVIFRGYRNKQKANIVIVQQKLQVEQQKLEVEKQRDIVEEKQKEILDSIHYAKRIQKSLMPTEKYINKNIERLKRK